MDFQTNIIVTLVISALLGISYALYQKISVDKIVILYNNGEYDIAFNKAIKKKARYDSVKHICKGTWSSYYDNLCFMIATVYFYRGDYDNFLLHINEIRDEKNQYKKVFWICIFHILTFEVAQAEEIYKEICTHPQSSETDRLVLRGLIASQKGLNHDAQKHLEYWMKHKQPKNPILNNIIDGELDKLINVDGK